MLNHLKHSFNDLRLIGGHQHARSEPRLHAASVSSASMATLAAAETARAAAGSGGSGLLGRTLDGGWLLIPRGEIISLDFEFGTPD